MVTYADILNKYGDKLEEIAEKLTDYGWNSPGNNWAGHHFTTPEGWNIKTASLHGITGHEGECVFVYDDPVMIYDYSYSFVDGRLWPEVLSPLVDTIREKTGCDHEKAVTVAEYIYARENCANR